MSLSLTAKFEGMSQVAVAMHQLSELDRRELLDGLGAESESQVRRRISSEKRAPNGVPWPAWSNAYAKTRHGGQSLLQGDGGLLDDIHYVVGYDQVEIGSNLPYARIHNEGGTIEQKARASTVYFRRDKEGNVGNRFVPRRQSNFAQDVTVGAYTIEMPARQYLGFSSENENSLLGIVRSFLADQIRAL
jgi:phage gpG-like protein